jgi:hypothetical protein
MPESTTRQLRRKDRQIDEQEARRLLVRSEYGVLSTVGSDGLPYGVPISYVFHANEILFHCAIEGRKLENLAASPRASFCVVGETELLPEQFALRYESAIAEGSVRELLGQEKIAALALLVEKYAPEYREKGAEYIIRDQQKTRVFSLAVEQLCGKRRR